MRCVSFAEVAVGAWDAACDESSEAWLFHRAAWVELEARYWALENLSFALVEGERVLAVQPLYRRELGLGTWTESILDSGVHRHTGLAVVDGARRRDACAAAMRRIFKLAEEADVDRIQLNVQNLAPRERSEVRDDVPFWVAEHGFDLGLQFGPGGLAPAPGMATLASDQIVELSPHEDELWRALHESCRRAVRKAQAGGVHLAPEPAGPVSDYVDLARLSATRTGETLPPPGYFHDVVSTLGPRARILLAVHEGRPVAGLLLLLEKGAVHFLAGASDPAALPLRVNDFVHWHAILSAKERGYACYRLGPTFPELPAEWPVARVARFKGKFGGRGRPIVQGSFFRRPERYRVVAETQLELLAAAKATA